MNPAERLLRAPFTLTGRAAEAALGEALEQGVVEHVVSEAAKQGTLDRLVDELVEAGSIDRAIDAVIERGVIDRVIDAVIERGQIDHVIDAVIERGQIDRVVDALAERGLIDRAVQVLIERGLIDRIVDAVLEGGTVARVASSPEVRTALAATSSGLADDVIGEVRRRAARADDAAGRVAARVLRRPRRAAAEPAEPLEPLEPFGAAGLISRLLAFGIDALVVVCVGLAITGMAAIVANLFARFNVSSALGVVVAVSTSAVATAAYFVLAWTLVGQTIGMRLLALRVVGPDGRWPSLVRALVLGAGTLLAVIPLFAGFLPVLAEPRRLALQDRLSRTRTLYEAARREGPRATSAHHGATRSARAGAAGATRGAAPME